MSGHRLLAFLQTALPQHPEYRLGSIASQRKQCFEDAIWLQSVLDEIALQIDEEQLNLFMDRDFEPPTDASSSSSSACSDEQSWEAFTDWAFKDEDSPRMVDTDTSDSVHNSSESETENDELPTSPRQFHFDIEEPTCALNEPVLASNFLKQIANEVVRYENDSEAADSWAQDGNSAALSGASSGTALTYDPARLAFREILNNIPTQDHEFDDLELTESAEL